MGPFAPDEARGGQQETEAARGKVVLDSGGDGGGSLPGYGICREVAGYGIWREGGPRPQREEHLGRPAGAWREEFSDSFCAVRQLQFYVPASAFQRLAGG